MPLDGAVGLIRHAGGAETVIARMDVPGRWAGGFRARDEQGVYLATRPRGVEVMDGKGTLRLSARAGQHSVVIEIADTPR